MAYLVSSDICFCKSKEWITSTACKETTNMTHAVIWCEHFSTIWIIHICSTITYSFLRDRWTTYEHMSAGLCWERSPGYRSTRLFLHHSVYTHVHRLTLLPKHTGRQLENVKNTKSVKLSSSLHACTQTYTHSHACTGTVNNNNNTHTHTHTNTQAWYATGFHWT